METLVFKARTVVTVTHSAHIHGQRHARRQWRTRTRTHTEAIILQTKYY